MHAMDLTTWHLLQPFWTSLPVCCCRILAPSSAQCRLPGHNIQARPRTLYSQPSWPSGSTGGTLPILVGGHEWAFVNFGSAQHLVELSMASRAQSCSRTHLPRLLCPVLHRYQHLLVQLSQQACILHTCTAWPDAQQAHDANVCRFDIIPSEGQRKLHALALCTLLHQPPPCLLTSLPTAVAHITSVWLEVSPPPA